MGHTYTTVSENARTEWMYERLSSVLEMVGQMHAVPPPFSLPILAFKFLKWLAQRVLACCLPLGWWGDGGAARGGIEGGTPGKPAEWRAGGRLWEQKIRLQETTRRAMREYKRLREREEGADGETRDARWDERFEEMLSSVKDVKDDLRLLKDDAREREEGTASCIGAAMGAGSGAVATSAASSLEKTVSSPMKRRMQKSSTVRDLLSASSIPKMDLAAAVRSV